MNQELMNMAAAWTAAGRQGTEKIRADLVSVPL
jgi:hypothetical protein